MLVFLIVVVALMYFMMSFFNNGLKLNTIKNSRVGIEIVPRAFLLFFLHYYSFSSFNCIVSFLFLGRCFFFESFQFSVLYLVFFPRQPACCAMGCWPFRSFIHSTPGSVPNSRSRRINCSTSSDNVPTSRTCS